VPAAAAPAAAAAALAAAVPAEGGVCERGEGDEEDWLLPEGMGMDDLLEAAEALLGIKQHHAHTTANAAAGRGVAATRRSNTAAPPPTPSTPQLLLPSPSPTPPHHHLPSPPSMAHHPIRYLSVAAEPSTQAPPRPTPPPPLPAKGTPIPSLTDAAAANQSSGSSSSSGGFPAKGRLSVLRAQAGVGISTSYGSPVQPAARTEAAAAAVDGSSSLPCTPLQPHQQQQQMQRGGGEGGDGLSLDLTEAREASTPLLHVGGGTPKNLPSVRSKAGRVRVNEGGFGGAGGTARPQGSSPTSSGPSYAGGQTHHSSDTTTAAATATAAAANRGGTDSGVCNGSVGGDGERGTCASMPGVLGGGGSVHSTAQRRERSTPRGDASALSASISSRTALLAELRASSHRCVGVGVSMGVWVYGRVCLFLLPLQGSLPADPNLLFTTAKLPLYLCSVCFPCTCLHQRPHLQQGHPHFQKITY
jgi:hypothetical protein